MTSLLRCWGRPRPAAEQQFLWPANSDNQNRSGLEERTKEGWINAIILECLVQTLSLNLSYWDRTWWDKDASTTRYMSKLIMQCSMAQASRIPLQLFTDHAG